MRASKISWGIVFIFIGVVFLLENYDIIVFSWSYIWRFWPFILIVTGINIIFSKSNSSAAKWLVILTTVFALGLLVYANVNTPKTLNKHWSYNFDEDIDEETDTALSERKSFYQEDYDARFKTATLNINGGASSFTIVKGNKNLFESSTQKNNERYYLRKTDTDSTVVLNFNSKSKNNNFDFDDTDLSTVAMKIHIAPLWDVNLNMGAGTANFDFSNNRVKQINIKGGAADFKVKIGELYNDVNLSAETGIAKVSILIPTASGCKINIKTGLSAKDFPGFEKADDGSFTSPNYASATNKIMIRLKGGLSDFEVKRY
ncbi:LiaF transmembrane domain-containing protein [Pedobacter arcticus]|uniref:LiaF transmembrane domain-containing protein n=1 Tax=Pedobacter arcticus TaxID=752140 RepID=UPI00031E721B|nr:DUF5668 domain-containing protein [Pedobacter arcticus]